MTHTALRRLALFDVDGTIITRVPGAGTPGFKTDRYVIPIEHVYGVRVQFDMAQFEGTGDRHIIRTLLQAKGITDAIIDAKFPALATEMASFLRQGLSAHQYYKMIPAAKELLETLRTRHDIARGLLTGNLEQCAWAKLEHVGLRSYFDFGLFGDEGNTRIEISQKVFAKAKKHFEHMFAPEDIVVIGDTVHDIRCGKAVGAKTIGVTSGYQSADLLEKEGADLLVDSLLDPRVLSMVGLS